MSLWLVVITDRILLVHKCRIPTYNTITKQLIDQRERGALTV